METRMGRRLGFVGLQRVAGESGIGSVAIMRQDIRPIQAVIFEFHRLSSRVGFSLLWGCHGWKGQDLGDLVDISLVERCAELVAFGAAVDGHDTRSTELELENASNLLKLVIECRCESRGAWLAWIC